jgi:hypothetical protein
MPGLTWALVGLVLGSQVASAQDVRGAIEQAVQRREAAIRSGDGAAWARLETDDFIVVGPTQRAADVTRGLTIQPPTDVRIPVYGDTAVRTFVAGDNRRVEVWVRQGGQ